MKVQTIVKTFSGGTVITVARSEVVEVTDAEYEDLVASMKAGVNSSAYLELDGVIIPGEFLKTRCIIQVVVA
jgi:hypothetical protein